MNQRPELKALIAAVAVTASALALSAGAAQAAESTKTAKAASTAKAAKAAANGIPRAANGKPDFSGIWEAATAADYDLEPHAGRPDAPPFAGLVEEGAIPYLPAALEQKKKNFANRDKDDPRLKGWTLGVPRGTYYPEPFQLFQRPQDITIVYQFGHSVRTIHTNGTKHPDGDRNDFWLGDSRAKWEGDTLVVDVSGFNDETWLDRAGNYHSDQFHVVERWRYLDPNTIEYKATLEDPQVYSKPWNISVLLHRHREKNFQLIEDYRFTQDYEQYYPPKPPANAAAAAQGAAQGAAK